MDEIEWPHFTLRYVWASETRRTHLVTVDRWPRYIAIDDIFLRVADPASVCVHDDMVTFTVENGEATYQFDGEYSLTRAARTARLVSSRLTEPDEARPS